MVESGFDSRERGALREKLATFWHPRKEKDTWDQWTRAKALAKDWGPVVYSDWAASGKTPKSFWVPEKLWLKLEGIDGRVCH